MPRLSLALTGIGAVTSVGLQAAAACAAIRAGIARPTPVDGVEVLDPETQAPVRIHGYPIRGYADGFQLLGRWLRLAGGALDDLGRTPAVPPSADQAFWARAACYAVTQVPDPEVFDADPRNPAEGMIAEGYLEPLGERWPGARPPELVAAGHAGTARALVLAAERIARREVEAALILAVDTCFDPLQLRLMAEDDRLKTGDHPTGFMPGEAAVALLVESPASAARRKARPLLQLTHVALGDEPSPFAAGGLPTGRGLAAVLREALDAVSPGKPFGGDLVADQNGEAWRAEEWGRAAVLVGPRLDARLHLPAESLGEIGASSGALGVALAAHLVARRAALTGQALVLSSGEDGRVGCVALAAAP